jgi:fatty-acyl-CoA synthase
MTETTPLGTASHVPPDLADASDETKYQHRAKQGRPAPFVEIRARNENGIIAWDGLPMGELEVRGPWVASAYYNRDDCGDRFTSDGWFKTGDVVTSDERARSASGSVETSSSRWRMDQFSRAGPAMVTLLWRKPP